MGILNWFGLGNSWRRIDRVPRWVRKAHSRWSDRLPTHPYDMRKHFVGKTFVYRVQHGTGAQGEAPILGWYMKRR